MWMWCVLVLTVCQQTLCIEQPFRHVAENTTCLDIKVESRLACTGSDQFYHCLLDENYTKEFEVCRDWKWIPGGKCAYFNSYGRGNVDERSCEGNSTLKCAPGQFRSYLNTQYKACYVKKRIPTTTPISTVTIRPTSSGGSVPPNITGGAPPGSVPPESQFDGSALGTALGVIVSLILPVVVVGILLFKRRDKQGTSKEEPSMERGEVEALLSKETKYQEENEQNDKQQTGTSKEEPTVESGESGTLLSTGTKCQDENEQNDKQQTDERTSTEAMESSPLLAGNTNQNQSQEDSVKNGDTSEANKLDSLQQNDSYQTPPTSPTTAVQVQTEDVDEKEEEEKEDKKEGEEEPGGRQSSTEGNEEDTSKETEKMEAVGTFVNSLESIEKEDDEEVGSSELQELLVYMCTGPARKILFNVVKMYVDNPDSYIYDESKKASLKTVLPPEYYSAINPESEYRKSIPVMYAILRSSLSEEHHPKSGWDQEVKDTDTGVGDDVERVYKVHTLHREIQKPEKISLDGYVRLFEMLIGAVDRLDVKGKCSEDYKEIVRRWENIQRTIQRKQWMKDKRNTFTNFIKKWSE